MIDPNELYHHGVKGMKWGKHLTAEQVNQAATDVMNGRYGNGDERKKNLGSHYSEIQKKVNEQASGKDSKDDKSKSSDKYDKNVKDGEKIAKQVIAGKFGNGNKRVKSLGSKYAYVQNIVNQKLLGKSKAKAIAKKRGWDFSDSKKSSKKTSSTKSSKSSTASKKSKAKSTSSKK